jgi:hypothetical protein
MTTIVLAHPNERCPRFQLFAVYEAPDVHLHLTSVEFRLSYMLGVWREGIHAGVESSHSGQARETENAI